MSEEQVQEWRTENSLVWTWATADPQLYARDNIEALRLAAYLNALQQRLSEAEAERERMIKLALLDRDVRDSMQRDIDKLQADLSMAVEALKFTLAFVPAWAREVPEGLDPTFYGTLSSAGDRRVMQRVAEVEALVARLSTPTEGVDVNEGA